MENADWTCIINPETKLDDNSLYLTFKLLKRRYRSIEEDSNLRRLDYFNHPFEENSEIRLVDDVDLPKSLSLTSLATQFQAAAGENKNGKTQAIERERSDKSGKKTAMEEIRDFDPFNPNKTDNL